MAGRACRHAGAAVASTGLSIYRSRERVNRETPALGFSAGGRGFIISVAQLLVLAVCPDLEIGGVSTHAPFTRCIPCERWAAALISQPVKGSNQCRSVELAFLLFESATFYRLLL